MVDIKLWRKTMCLNFTNICKTNFYPIHFYFILKNLHAFYHCFLQRIQYRTYLRFFPTDSLAAKWKDLQIRKFLKNEKKKQNLEIQNGQWKLPLHKKSQQSIRSTNGTKIFVMIAWTYTLEIVMILNNAKLPVTVTVTIYARGCDDF